MCAARLPAVSAVGAMTKTQGEYSTHMLDLFSSPALETTMLPPGKEVTYYPAAALTDDSPVQFDVMSSNDDYLLLDSVRLHGEVKIMEVGADGALGPTTKDVSVVNYFPHAMWSQVRTELNGVDITAPTSSTYPYKAYIEYLMCRATATKSTYGTPALWYTDSIDLDQNKSTTGAAGAEVAIHAKEGWMRRKERVKDSKSVFFSTPLHVDLFEASLCLPPGCNLKLKFLRHPRDAFAIMYVNETTKFHVAIKNLRLTARKMNIAPAALNAHASLWTKHDVRLPLIRSHIGTHFISAQTTSRVFPTVSSGVLPKQMIVGFVNAAAFEGQQATSPFSFKHFDVNAFSFRINGVQHPSTSYEPNYTTGDYTKVYQDLVDRFGGNMKKDSLPFDYDDFPNNYCLYTLSLSPDDCAMFHKHGEMVGNIDIHVSFNTPTPQPLQMIVYQARSNMISINSNREVKLDLP